MTSATRELYQEVLLDHGNRPRNHRVIAGARNANGHNPLCGDRITVYVKLDGDVVEDISFEGTGCAISTASASMMTSALKGKTLGEARALFDRFHQALTGEQKGEQEALGKLAVLVGVREFPSRVKCATLAWHTLYGALEIGPDVTVTTEGSAVGTGGQS
ncbi:MAG: SUF system NifU family Fe-S cluster assembly protein [Polyangiaceae bacterium]|jgi:nitrogen fixation NifU-like protein|nr:SUF system NifU family Fe-S cluster assembly protein [Polyangiaceae bacterium]